MISDVLRFLKDRLNKALPRENATAPAEDLFVYAGSGKDDAVAFKSDAVSVLLVKIEEETALRAPDPYRRITAAGVPQRIDPDIRMNLYVLFVARCADDYGRSLAYLSRVIRYFQGNRIFNHTNSPELGADISQISLELVTPSFSEQNEIWGTLRTGYLPSAMYKVRMIVFTEEGEALVQVKEVSHKTVQIPP